MYSDAHWRDSARRAKFFFLDAYAFAPLIFWFLHPRLWTFILLMVIVTFLSILEYFGFTLTVFMRWLKVFLGGKLKVAKPWWKE